MDNRWSCAFPYVFQVSHHRSGDHSSNLSFQDTSKRVYETINYIIALSPCLLVKNMIIVQTSL